MSRIKRGGRRTPRSRRRRKSSSNLCAVTWRIDAQERGFEKHAGWKSKIRVDEIMKFEGMIFQNKIRRNEELKNDGIRRQGNEPIGP